MNEKYISRCISTKFQDKYIIHKIINPGRNGPLKKKAPSSTLFFRLIICRTCNLIADASYLSVTRTEFRWPNFFTKVKRIRYPPPTRPPSLATWSSDIAVRNNLFFFHSIRVDGRIWLTVGNMSLLRLFVLCKNVYMHIDTWDCC